jgi:hypothetical protein
MMFKRLVMLVSGLMGRQSTAPSSLTAEQPSLSAKPLPAKSFRGSRPAARKPASQKPKSKALAAPQTKAVVLRKPKPKPARQMSGETGSQSATPASPTHQPAKPALTKKPKAAVLTSQVKKPTPSKTAARTRTARPSKASGS